MDLLFLAIAIACLGLWLTLSGLLRLLRLQLLSGTARTGTGATLSVSGALLLAVAVNLSSYHHLSNDQPLAQLYFTQIGPQQFIARVVLLDDEGNSQVEQKFHLHGDDWQVDSRVLKWHPLLQWLGLRPLHKLDRISGRYRDITEARSAQHTLYPLNQDDPGLDIWPWLQNQPQWQPWVDARYGSATFLPMIDQARFTLYLGQDGLLARPANKLASQVLSQ